MEDLHEADVLWPEEPCHRESRSYMRTSSAFPLRKQQQQKSTAASVPIGIPTPHASVGPWSFRMITSNGTAHNCGEEDEVLEAEESNSTSSRVPPHLLLATRRANKGCQKMAFSVCIGQGRTLKGRDLSEVRNLVLQLTGFLEGEPMS